MALLEKHLLVKESSLPGAGQGLFSKIDIPANTKIVEYKGRLTNWKDVENDHDNGYLYVVNDNFVIDAGKTKKAFARYANDARGISRVKGVTNNCEYVNDEDGKVYIVSKKEIRAGQEILVSYGKEYWDVIRHNIKVEKLNEKKVNAKKKTVKRKRN